MARNRNKGKGVGGIQTISNRKKKEKIYISYMNRKKDLENKSPR
jgi:hypothetical protein